MTAPDWFQRGTIPALCVELRAHSTGAYGHLSDAELASLREYLTARLTAWQPKPDPFDVAVLQLLRATLGAQ